MPTRDLTLKPGKVLGFFINFNDVDELGRAKITSLWRKVGNNAFYCDNLLWGYLLMSR